MSLISMTMTFINNTGITFTRGEYDLNMKEGTFEPYPPVSIASHSTVTIIAVSTSPFTGLEGSVTYHAQYDSNKHDRKMIIYFDIPLAGGNTYDVNLYELPELTYDVQNISGYHSYPTVTIKYKN
ncbi:hypothetical protein FE392_04410 [Xenorhabdus sp. 12]|uniref:Uncharacterized protein n=1 Tax=Xenorhabdus santafensis TaxID=2582833 RepID=A0ABU4S5U5_9GAMM|nr:hypothetical protein [Xenorhabdus sp. 12]MDX7986578.1 hypothetical protein [Xenorhabdus sp. 12]